jgi:Phage head-tail joining protein
MLQKRQPALAGLLRETVTFQQHALDANGDRLGPWTDVFAAQARVVMQTRAEGVLQQRVAGVQPVEVTLRLDLNSAQVDTDWRLVWLNWPFEITAVAMDELGAAVSILAVRAREVETAS